MTHERSNTRRLRLPAFAGLLASPVDACQRAPQTAAVTPWGELGHRAPGRGHGTGPGRSRNTRRAFAVDPTDGSYYVADELDATTPEYRIQRFNAKGEVGSVDLVRAAAPQKLGHRQRRR